jgi:hypothetical protein
MTFLPKIDASFVGILGVALAGTLLRRNIEECAICSDSRGGMFRFLNMLQREGSEN